MIPFKWMTKSQLIRLACVTSIALIQVPVAMAQGTPTNFSLPAVPKVAEFNVPLNFSNLPPAYYKELHVTCVLYETPEPPAFIGGASQLAAAGETVTVVNGTYSGVVKVKVPVKATDVAKAKSWRCQVMANGPAGSGVNSFNLYFWKDLPEGAQPDLSTQWKTGAGGKYN